MNKAIILARVSTKEQEEQGLSIEKIQLPQLRQYAKDHDFIIDKEFIFQETAGANKVRKKFDEMVEYVKNTPDILAIIGFRVDRLTRNFSDAVNMDSLRIEYGKELHFVSDGLILTNKTMGNSITEWDMKVFLAKQLINRCQEDSRNTLMSKLKSGDSYGQAPYGYKNNTETKTIEKLPFESELAKEVFDLYTTGAHSYLQIAQMISKEHKIKFGKGRVEHILINPFYYGERLYDGQLYPVKAESIITKEVFELATKIRSGRFKTEKQGKLLGKNGWYHGLIYCAECGCSYSATKNRHLRLHRKVRSESYYSCTNSKHQHNVKPKGTNDYELTNQLSELYKSIKIPEKNLKILVNALSESHEGKKQFIKLEIDNCNTQIKKYESMIENAYEDKCAGRITQESYDNFRDKWRSKQDEFTEKLVRVMKADKEYYITVSCILELAFRSNELFIGSKPEQKREIIQLTLKNLRIKDGKLLYDWQKPFDSIFISNERHAWGGWVDSNHRPPVPQTGALTS